MASYHLSVKVLSRSGGRSAVAAAAYRSRGQLPDVRQGMNFDYSGKDDLGHSEIMAPEGSPSWVYDRSELWNRVEANEKRKDAQLMREVEVALPKELSSEEQIGLLRDYCRDNFVKHGMVADINVHEDGNNPHAHIMLTMRKIEGEGFGKKERSWNSKGHILKWREEWANHQNIHLAKAGFDIRVDHRSYAEQGVMVEPQVKRGITTHNQEIDAERAEAYRSIAFENGKRIIDNPEFALEHITKYQSTFTHDDLLKYVHAHTDESQFFEALEAVTNSPEIVLVQRNDYERFNRYTTNSLMKIENQMLSTASKMSGSNNHHVEERFIEQASVNCNLSTEQKRVLRNAVGGADVHAIVGHAGTGKSYTLNAIREAYEAQGYHLQGVSLSGVAAEGLEKSSGIQSSTIHRKFYDWDNGRHQLNSNSILVIDEAGMVGTRQMQRLLEEADNAGAKVVVVGDVKQTQAIEAGGAFRGVLNCVEYSRLSEVWRQHEDWQKDATRLLSGNREEISMAMNTFDDHGNIHSAEDYKHATSRMLSDYVRNYSKDQTSVMIAHTNEDVERLNLVGRNNLMRRPGLISEDQIKIKTSTGVKYFSEGDRILFLKNEQSIGVKNGTFGTVEEIDGIGNLVVSVGNDRSVVVNSDQYNSFTYGYAATVHKLQGATVGRSYVLASEGFDRHLGYVALSRHRDSMNLYYSQDKFQNFEHLKRQFSNLGEKELISDHQISSNDVDGMLKALTSNNATFTEKDYRPYVEKLDEDLRPEFLDRIQSVGWDNKGIEKFSTVEMVDLERRLFDSSSNMGEQYHHVINQKEVDDLLSGRQLNGSQRFVVNRIVDGSDLVMVNHEPGADRGVVAGSAAAIYRDQGYVVEAVSLSGMGAKSFENNSGVPSSTVYQKLWEWEGGKNNLNDKSVLMIDNANHIGTSQMQRLLYEAEGAGAKVVTFGDTQTLQSIEAGGAYRGILERSPATKATLSRDQQISTWEHEARDLFRGDSVDAANAIDLYAHHGCIERTENPANAVVTDWINNVSPSNFENTEVGPGDERGRVLFHSTNKAFDSFSHTDQIGFRFGSFGQASDSTTIENADSRIIKATVDIRRPLRLGRDWNDRQEFDLVVRTAIKKQIENEYRANVDSKSRQWLPGTDVDGVRREIKNLNDLDKQIANIRDENLSDEQYFGKCREALRGHGYDGLVYEIGTKKAENSYVAFDAQQIKQEGVRYPGRESSYQNNMMLAYRNADVQELNLMARDRLKGLGYVDNQNEVTIKTRDKGQLAVAGGDRLMFLKKDDSAGIKSGTLGTVRSVEGDRLSVRLDQGETVNVDTRVYNDLNYGYAATVYRASGLRVENTYIMATEHYNKHISSAALSAHSHRAKVYHNLGYNNLKNKMSRAADKDLAADYPMGTKAYKVTLRLKDHSRPKEKYLMVGPQINKEAEKQDLRRQTMAFANTEARKEGMKPDELRGLNIKVEQVPLEMYQEKTRQKSIKQNKGIER